MTSTERKMAAILAMDVTSYSEKMGRDEEGTLKHLRACKEIIETVVNCVNNTKYFIVALFLDDLLIVGSTKNMVTQLKSIFEAKFKMKN